MYVGIEFCVDKTQAISFLEGLLSDEKRKAVYGPDATLLCTFLLAKTKLEVSYEKYGDEVKKMLEEKKEQVEGLVGAEPIVHASYYIVACNYYQEIGPAELFYKNALMYLAYSPYENMKQKDRADLAVNISLAALAGDGIFNFGQVLVTPILKALTGTEKEWLADLLNAFNKGDIEQFNTIMSKKQSEFDAQPALANKKQFIKEKIALMALMDLVFHRPAHDRTLTFEEIAIRTCLPLEQIEWLLMRAMSLKLIEGIIDQVDGNVSISYIQSRVLDKSQMTELKDRLSEWSTKVKDILLFVEEQTPELFE